MSKSSADRENDRIDMSNPEQVDYWTQQFGISVQTLKNLIETNGVVASNIRLILGK
jgi:hypothetical protein